MAAFKEKLTRTEIRVYLYLCSLDRSGRSGWVLSPKGIGIAKSLGITLRAARSATRALSHRGLLIKNGIVFRNGSPRMSYSIVRTPSFGFVDAALIDCKVVGDYLAFVVHKQARMKARGRIEVDLAPSGFDFGAVPPSSVATTGFGFSRSSLRKYRAMARQRGDLVYETDGQRGSNQLIVHGPGCLPRTPANAGLSFQHKNVAAPSLFTPNNPLVEKRKKITPSGNREVTEWGTRGHPEPGKREDFVRDPVISQNYFKEKAERFKADEVLARDYVETLERFRPIRKKRAYVWALRLRIARGIIPRTTISEAIDRMKTAIAEADARSKRAEAARAWAVSLSQQFRNQEKETMESREQLMAKMNALPAERRDRLRNLAIQRLQNPKSPDRAYFLKSKPWLRALLIESEMVAIFSAYASRF